jgi:hypothetical protein
MPHHPQVSQQVRNQLSNLQMGAPQATPIFQIEHRMHGYPQLDNRQSGGLHESMNQYLGQMPQHS